MERSIGEQDAIDRAREAEQTTRKTANDFKVAGAAVRYAIEKADDDALSYIARDAGLEEVTLDDLVAAQAAVERYEDRETGIANGLSRSAAAIETDGLRG